jgi:hypothetical protein
MDRLANEDRRGGGSYQTTSIVEWKDNYMPRKIPPHVELGDKNDPPGWNGGSDEMIVMLTYRPVPGHPDQVQFVFDVSANFPYKAPAADLQFEIQRDCKIIFKLDSKLNSRWSKQYYFITGKDRYRHLYGDVDYIDDRTFSVKAKYHTGGGPGDSQSFNLNIDYGQLQDAQGKWSYVPITIDPDVGNPRPPGLRPEISGSITVPLIGTVGE